MKDPVASWNEEYNRRGIPSSHRDEPSSVLGWALSNLAFVSSEPIRSAIDLGCGTGRNAIALSEFGVPEVSGLDFSENALSIARKRSNTKKFNFIRGDLTKSLPFLDNKFDLATDIFVYFHQLPDDVRACYRREIHRVLRPGGQFLVSLATTNDGYYSSCPIGPLKEVASTVRLTWDPIAEVGNILLTFDELTDEFSDLFELQMTWIKRKAGQMHGAAHLRETVAMLWRARVKPWE